MSLFQFVTESYHDITGASQIGLVLGLQRPQGGQKLSLAVTHLKAKEGFEKLREQQAEAVCDLVLANAAALSLLPSSSSSTMSVIACDMNDVPSSLAAEVMRKRGFGSAYGQLEQETYTTSKIRKELTTRCIDYIWISSEGKCDAVMSIPSLDRLGIMSDTTFNFSILIDSFW